MAVVIQPNEHVFIAGQTGTGKTYLARKYLAGYRNVVVLDTKGTLVWPEVPEDQLTVVTRLSELAGATTPKILYRPVWEEMNLETYNLFFEWVYRRQNTIVWIDEAMSVCPNPFKMPEYYKAILTRGRELGLAAWSLSQRPSGIPAVIISEATHIFVFRLNMPQDRQKLVEITGQPELEQRPDKYVFWYFDVREERPILAKLVERKGGNAKGTNSQGQRKSSTADWSGKQASQG